MTYLEACRTLLKSVASGRYWIVSADFGDGPLFDPPELQTRKATVILQELDAQIAQFPDPETLPDTHCGKGSRIDTKAKIMMLQMDAETKFREAVTRKDVVLADNPL